MNKADQIELAIYRGNLLQKSYAPRAFSDACKVASRHVARLDRWRIAACNGVARYDAKLGCAVMAWDESDQARADKETTESRKAIEAALKPFLTRGVAFKYYDDPRAGSVLRIRDAANIHECFI